MRLIFMGSPAFAVPTLEALLKAGHEIVLVCTQTDKPKGRSKKAVSCPVKAFAVSENLPVFQPVSLRRKSSVETLKACRADAVIVSAYGKILPKEVLSMTPLGCFNVHASLLPKYRGAAPVEWAILDGETETGITIMQMDEGLDTGDILKQVIVPISPDDTGDSLTKKLSLEGAGPLLEILELAGKGQLSPEKQGESPTAYASMLTKEMGELDFSDDAEKLEKKIRAFYSWPSAYTFLNGKMLKICRAEVCAGRSGCVPGEIISVTKKDFTVSCQKGALRIRALQAEGKKEMETDAFLRGNKLTEGMLLGR